MSAGRGPLTWTGLLAGLYDLVDAPPTWMRPKTVEAATKLLALATADAVRAASGQTRPEQAVTLGTSERTLHRWVQGKAWLEGLPLKKD